MSGQTPALQPVLLPVDADQKSAVHEAKGVFKILIDANAAGDRDCVVAMFARLDKLRDTYPADDEIAMCEANAVVNVTRTGGHDLTCIGSDEMFVRLGALRLAFRTHEDIAMASATTILNVIADAAHKYDWKRILEMWERIDKLCHSLPDMENLGVRIARSATFPYMSSLTEIYPPDFEFMLTCAHRLQVWFETKLHLMDHTVDKSAGIIVILADAMIVMKDAYQRFPEDEAITQIYHQLTEAGVAWDRVRDIEVEDFDL
ncbi:MAG: hypothetical protein JKY49_16865 [Cohaesibacteraceae bacterium]|nr:hypothetical protein [Cohaesibacteraceae bacterium]